MDSRIPRDSNQRPPNMPTPSWTCPASTWEMQLTYPAIYHDIKADPVGFHQGAEFHPSFISIIFGKPGETQPRGDLSLAGPSLFGNTDKAAWKFISTPIISLTAASGEVADPLADIMLKIRLDSQSHCQTFPKRQEVSHYMLDQPGATQALMEPIWQRSQALESQQAQSNDRAPCTLPGALPATVPYSSSVSPCTSHSDTHPQEAVS